MASFDIALQVTLTHEGGFFHNQTTGEIVNMGVTLASYREVDPAADENTIRNLTEQQASDFYRSHYWNILKLDGVQDQTLASKIFDLGVNMGVGTITRIVQEAVNSLGHSITVDGRMGTITLAAINLTDPAQLLSEIRDLAGERYQKIAADDPRHAGDLAGWLQRLDS